MEIEKWNDQYLSGEFRLKTEFMSGQTNRSSVIERCEQYAKWSIPSVFPDDDYEDNQALHDDFQSIGALCVTNLVNKVMMTLFQPTRPFFKLELTNEQVAELAGQWEAADIEVGLSETERDAMRLFLQKHGRVALTQCILLLVITGNVLLYCPPKEKRMMYYSLKNYAVWRDLEGEVNKIIICQTKRVGSLSDELQSIVVAAQPGIDIEAEVSIYTGILRIGDRYKVWQELEDLCYCHIGAPGDYAKDALPWRALTWNLAAGNDYGSGKMEEHRGDFGGLSRLSEVSIQYASVVTDVKHLVNPTGMTDVSDLVDSASGAYVLGREEDIFVHQAQVQSASNFIDEKMDKIERRLGQAFLLNSAVTRDAERVTAQEIRMQASELEQAMGGVYSHLSTELQSWLAKRLTSQISPAFKDVEPSIITGLESLSRSSDTDRWRYFFQDLIALADVPEEVRIRTDFGNLIAIMGAGHGVDYKKVLKDEQAVEAERERIAEANAAAAGAEAGAVSDAQQ